VTTETTDNTPLAARMKRYEHAYRDYLPRRTHTLMRLDGKAFHSYLKGAERPYDHGFIAQMNLVAIRLCEEAQGAQFAYVQSDEISLLLTDFETPQTEPWFGGNSNKLLSVPASLAAAYLGRLRVTQTQIPQFDNRLWTMSDPVEVANYFVWRQRDAVSNSIQMAGQTYFSHAELTGKSTNNIQEMLFTKHDVNWNDFPAGCKRGRVVFRDPEEGWVAAAAPHFAAEPGNFLADHIPPLPTLWS
jgi:tRNA(His) 5'-end guanylyltransferase